MPTLCRAFGLLVETEIAIPGALPAASGSGSAQPDLVIRQGTAELSNVRVQFAPYRLGREGLLFEKAGVASYLCAPTGDHMQVEVSPGAAACDVSDYLIATALPAILWMRNEMVLHGGAFVPPGERNAVALAGPSGSGKSTVLHSLVKAGAVVVAEDSLCVRDETGALKVSGLAGCLHLRRPDAPIEERRAMFQVPAAQRRASAELEAVVVLQPGNDGDDRSLIRADSAAALEALLHHRHRPNVPDLLGRSAGLLPRWATVARSVPVYFWRFPEGELLSTGQGPAWRMLAALNECMESAL